VDLSSANVASLEHRKISEFTRLEYSMARVRVLYRYAITRSAAAIWLEVGFRRNCDSLDVVYAISGLEMTTAKFKDPTRC
jgi:hypothetical protein